MPGLRHRAPTPLPCTGPIAPVPRSECYDPYRNRWGPLLIESLHSNSVDFDIFFILFTQFIVTPSYLENNNYFFFFNFDNRISPFFHVFSALSDNEPVYAQVDRHHKTRTPERTQRTHRRHMSACVQVPPVESVDDSAVVPVHEQLVNNLTASAADSLNLNVIRREYHTKFVGGRAEVVGKTDT